METDKVRKRNDPNMLRHEACLDQKQNHTVPFTERNVELNHVCNCFLRTCKHLTLNIAVLDKFNLCLYLWPQSKPIPKFQISHYFICLKYLLDF